MQRFELRMFFILVSLTVLLGACGSGDTSTGFVGGGDGDTETEASDGEGCTLEDRPTAACPDGGTCGTFEWQWADEPDCEWLCQHHAQNEGESCVLSGGGQGVCQQGLCLASGGDTDAEAPGESESEVEAEPDPSCEAPIDCIDQLWDIRCVGHWSCTGGLCEETCDDVQCGDGVCKPGKGESEASCSLDCDGQTYCVSDADCSTDEICKNGMCHAVDECLGVMPPDCTSENPCVESYAVEKPTPRCWACESENASNGTTCLAASGEEGVCRDGRCNLDVEPGDCSDVEDCLGLLWMVNCIGHWSCQQGQCAPICDFEGCGDGTCDTENGETEYSCGSDCAVVTQCREPIDCLPLSWNVRCWGRWSCEDGQCVEVCDFDLCGNGTCDENQGESAMSCNEDCLGEQSCNVDGDCPPRFACLAGRCKLNEQTCDNMPQPDCYNPGPCMEGRIQSLPYPECWTCTYDALPDGSECMTDNGATGQCQDGLCTGGTTPECNQPYDCLDHEWLVDCVGHWVCERGICAVECSDGLCGDGQCSPFQGESYQTCYDDCRVQGGDRSCDENTPCMVSDVDCGCYGTLPTGEESCNSTLPIFCECMGGRCGCPDGTCVDDNASWLKVLTQRDTGVAVGQVNVTVFTSTSSGNDVEVYRTVTGDDGVASIFIGSGAYRIMANKAVSPIETLWGETAVFVTSTESVLAEITLQSVW